jgi:hypothetical protein
MNKTGNAQMIELVAVEIGEVEMIDFGTENNRAAWTLWIIEQNEELVAEGSDAVDYRIVDADTRNCPSRMHDSSHHATICTAGGWSWENLGQ